MNKINPIYILALIFTIFLISTISLVQKKSEFIEKDKEYKTINKLSKNFKEYKENWFEKEKIKSSIEKILNSPIFKKEKVLFVETKNGLKIKIESENQKTLNSFLNRVLNEKFITKNLDIQKEYIQIEIGY